MEHKQIVLSMTADEAAYVLNVLAGRPFNEVAKIITSFQAQIREIQISEKKDGSPPVLGDRD